MHARPRLHRSSDPLRERTLPRPPRSRRTAGGSLDGRGVNVGSELLGRVLDAAPRGADRLPDVQRIDFSQASFGGRATFGRATFGGRPSFTEATFGDDASFDEAVFDGVWFDRATFGNEARFDQADLGDSAVLDGARFGNAAKWRAEQQVYKLQARLAVHPDPGFVLEKVSLRLDILDEVDASMIDSFPSTEFAKEAQITTEGQFVESSGKETTIGAAAKQAPFEASAVGRRRALLSSRARSASPGNSRK